MGNPDEPIEAQEESQLQTSQPDVPVSIPEPEPTSATESAPVEGTPSDGPVDSPPVESTPDTQPAQESAPAQQENQDSNSEE